MNWEPPRYHEPPPKRSYSERDDARLQQIAEAQRLRRRTRRTSWWRRLWRGLTSR